MKVRSPVDPPLLQAFGQRPGPSKSAFKAAGPKSRYDLTKRAGRKVCRLRCCPQPKAAAPQALQTAPGVRTGNVLAPNSVFTVCLPLVSQCLSCPPLQAWHHLSRAPGPAGLMQSRLRQAWAHELAKFSKGPKLPLGTCPRPRWRRRRGKGSPSFSGLVHLSR